MSMNISIVFCVVFAIVGGSVKALQGLARFVKPKDASARLQKYVPR